MSLAWFLPLPGSYAGVDEVGVYNFACSLHEVLAKHPFLPHGCGLFSGSYFPSFSEGLSLRRERLNAAMRRAERDFPSFSEGLSLRPGSGNAAGDSTGHFPSFSEGLSLRLADSAQVKQLQRDFPSFSEGLSLRPCYAERSYYAIPEFPFLFGGTFIEASERWGV